MDSSIIRTPRIKIVNISGYIHQIKQQPRDAETEEIMEIGDCSICLEPFDTLHSLCYTHCDHYFHTECLLAWCVENFSCPVCRAEITGCQHGSCTGRQGFLMEHRWCAPNLLEQLVRANHNLTSALQETELELQLLREFLSALSNGVMITYRNIQRLESDPADPSS